MRCAILWLSLLCVTTAEAQTRRSPAEAGQPQATSAAAHGGKTARSEAHRWEVVFGPESIRLYAYDAQGRPVSAKGIRGRIDMLLVRSTANSVRRGVNHQSTGASLRYQSASPGQGRLRDCLVAKHSMGEVEVQGLRVDVSLTHVADEPRGEVSFRVEFVAYSGESEWACAVDGCTRVVFVDPGSCPKCDAPLRRRERAQAQRDAAQAGDDQADGDSADVSEADGADADRPRRWPRRGRRR